MHKVSSKPWFSASAPTRSACLARAGGMAGTTPAAHRCAALAVAARLAVDATQVSAAVGSGGGRWSADCWRHGDTTGAPNTSGFGRLLGAHWWEEGRYLSHRAGPEDG